MGVRLLVGTAKGGFWVTSDDHREWAVEGPFFKGWKVTAGDTILFMHAVSGG